MVCRQRSRSFFWLAIEQFWTTHCSFPRPVCLQQTRALSGRNDDGTLKTAVGKEYPAPLRQAISIRFRDFALKAEHLAVPPADVVPPMDFHSLAKPFIVSISQSSDAFGADFVDDGELPLLQLPKL